MYPKKNQISIIKKVMNAFDETKFVGVVIDDKLSLLSQIKQTVAMLYRN